MAPDIGAVRVSVGTPAAVAAAASGAGSPAPAPAPAAAPPAALGAVEAAAALLEAVHAPLRLEWRVEMAGGGSVALSADVGEKGVPNSSCWPPRRLLMTVAPSDSEDRQNELTLSLPASTAAEHLEGLIRAAAAAAAARPPPVGRGQQLEQAREAHLSRAFAELNRELGGPAGGGSVAGCGPVPAELQGMQLVGSDSCRRVFQPLCLQQWHGDACGHHALYNVSCLLGGRASELRHEGRFWESTLRNIAVLAAHGERSGRWPRSRVTGGVADEVHLRELVGRSEDLRDSISVVSNREDWGEQLRRSGPSDVRTALEEVRLRRRPAHGFIFGATVHWYAVVVFAPPEAGAAPHLAICDSENAPMWQLSSQLEAERAAEERVQANRGRYFEHVKREVPDFEHRPAAQVWQAVDEGVPEWWKGIQKSSLFWRLQPLSVRRAIRQQEYVDMFTYLNDIAMLTGMPQAESHSEL